MIIEIRRAFPPKRNELQIFVDKKIAYFAKIGKRLQVFDKNGNPLTKKLKKGLSKEITVSDKSAKSDFGLCKFEDNQKKINYYVRKDKENTVYRVQRLSKSGVNYLLFTNEKKTLAVAGSVKDKHCFLKLYLKNEDKALAFVFLLLCLLLLKNQKIL